MPVAQNDDFTVSILQDDSYAFVKIYANWCFVIDTPECSTVHFAVSLEKLCLKAPKNPLSVGCIACDVWGGSLYSRGKICKHNSLCGNHDHQQVAQQGGVEEFF